MISINLLVKVQCLFRIVFPDINIGFTLVLLTIIMYLPIGILQAIIVFLKNRNILESFYSFIYFFLGCFSGGVLGSISGAFLGIIFITFTPAGDGLMIGLSGMGIADTLIDTIIIFWFVGVSIGSVITAIPLIESFNNQ